VAVAGADTAIASSASSVIAFGPVPVSAQTVRPPSRAACIAASTLPLLPLVDSPRKTSPGRPCACTWRAKTASYP
jgi:hypothetical protein